MKKYKNIIPLFIFSSVLFILPACVDQNFDEPEAWEIPEGEVLTIAELRNLYAQSEIRFEEDYSVYATVTMDDKSGNIYRSAYVQDETGAINLRTVAPGAIYEGDSVRISLRGTTLSSYQRMLQLDNVNADRNIKKLDVKKEVEPKTVSIPEINTGDFQAHLVRLENVQFAAADTGKPFADSENLVALNRTLEDCNGNRIIVRTSGYAQFADQLTPSLNGELVGVVSQFGNTMQLLIRSYDELDMQDDRCPIPGDDYDLITLAELRQNYQEGQTQIPPNTRIEGIVISDRENENHPGQNLFMMDESEAGIALRFESWHDFPLGQNVRVIVSNMELVEFNGLLQIENIPIGNAHDMGPGTVPDPVQTTINEVANNMDQFESTLVTFSGVVISGGNTYSGNLTLDDGTGQMLMYTYSWASFADAQPPSEPVTITGIVSRYNEPQLLIRNLNDVFIE